MIFFYRYYSLITAKYNRDKKLHFCSVEIDFEYIILGCIILQNSLILYIMWLTIYMSHDHMLIYWGGGGGQTLLV